MYERYKERVGKKHHGIFRKLVYFYTALVESELGMKNSKV